MLVEDVVLLQVACEFQSRIGEHHPERALDVFRPGGRVDLIVGADELRSDVLLVGISQMLGTELDGLGLAVVAIVNFDNTATRLIDYDSIWPARIVLIEIAADEKEQSQDDPAACEENNGPNILNRSGVSSGKSFRKKSSATARYCVLVTMTISSRSSREELRLLQKQKPLMGSVRGQPAFQSKVEAATENNKRTFSYCRLGATGLG